jgi:AcrR family transcriptional regulator
MNTRARKVPIDKASPKRRVGRPRSNGSDPTVDPEEDILQAAGRLFSERGFLGTSTSQIAASAGLRQSAIFHWFPTKEAILERLFSRGWDRSLEYFALVGASQQSGAVKTCVCLTYDARLVAGAEPYIQVMIVPPELRQPRFKRLLQKRQRLISYLEDFIRQGIKEGDFREVDPADAARVVLAVDEMVLDAARIRARRSPQSHAAMVVDFALHALVAQRSSISRILRLMEEHVNKT